MFCDRHILPRLKGRIYRTTIKPAMIYGVECLPFKKQYMLKISVVEIRMLRWVCGKIRKEFRSSIDSGLIKRDLFEMV